MADITQEQVVEYLSGLTVMDLVKLTETLEGKWGVKAAPVAIAGAAAPVEQKAAAEEPTEFNVVLANAGDKKIQVIKTVRELTGLGLKEAKTLVDDAPKVVKEAVSKQDAEEIAKKLEESGAKVEIKPA